MTRRDRGDDGPVAEPDRVPFGFTAACEIADEDPETLLSAFAERGWGDGLPLVAPTPARVEAMLAGVDADPDEVVAVLAPRGGEASIGVIAVNAVLAGCEPRHLPVLVAAVRALARPEVNLAGVNATTHPVAPLLVVHGRAADEGGYNAGAGALGPGNRANATTGRALRLILLHVAGAVPAVTDASTQGSPAKYTYCTAENVAATPWPAFAVRRGVGSDSAVTVHCGEAPHNVHDMESADPARLLDKMASALASTGHNQACISGGDLVVLLCPEHAATVAGAGWGPDDVAARLFQRARLPVGELRRAFDLRAWAPWMEAAGDDELLPIVEHPDHIHVIVVGGPGKHSSVVPSWGMTRLVTEPVGS